MAAFLEAYKAERVDVKPNTVKAWNTSIKRLVAFFGDVPLRNVTHEKTALYRVHLVQDGYREASISKMIGVAHRRKLIDDNPFQYVERGSQINKDREYYVTEDEARLLIDACPNAKSRLIIALARYAGLRIPSELRGLRWSEINWADGRFIVHSPKTERKGKPKRVVPIFWKLRPYLEEAFEVSPEGEDRIFPEIHDKKSMGSWIHKLADRAGVKLWEKPFQNMRSSCATDLNDEFPSKACAEWLGHTEQIADRHYRQVTDEHFERATKGGTKSVTAHAGNTLQINEAKNKNAVNCSVLQPTANACDTENGRTESTSLDRTGSSIIGRSTPHNIGQRTRSLSKSSTVCRTPDICRHSLKTRQIFSSHTRLRCRMRHRNIMICHKAKAQNHTNPPSQIANSIGQT